MVQWWAKTGKQKSQECNAPGSLMQIRCVHGRPPRRYGVPAGHIATGLTLSALIAAAAIALAALAGGLALRDEEAAAAMLAQDTLATDFLREAAKHVLETFALLLLYVHAFSFLQVFVRALQRTGIQ